MQEVHKNDAVLRRVRHEVWAGLKLLAFCADLTQERLTEKGLPTIPPDSEGLLPIAELIQKEGRIGQRIEALLARPFDPTRVVRTSEGTATTGIVLAQFVHHGSDHRAHIGTILGAHGVQPPDLDVWTYGQSVGEEIVST